MLKKQKVKIEINRGNLPYYSKLINNIKIGDNLELDLEIIPKGSNILISATCDICNNDIMIKYNQYIKRFKHKGNFVCSKKCSAIRTKTELMDQYGVSNIAQVPDIKEKIKNTNIERYGSENYISSDDAIIKRKETMIERWGVDNPMKSDLIKENSKKTNLEKWGTEFVLSNNEIREKIKSTNIKKYGYETASKNNLIKEKIILTNIKRWGGKSPMCNQNIKDKSKNTLFKNYGVNNPLKSEEIKDRLKKTNLSRLGVEYPTQSDKVKEKIKNSNLNNWGTIHVWQSDLFRMKNTKIGSELGYIMYKGDNISKFLCENGHEFEINTDNYFSRKRQELPICTICYPISDVRSISENIIYDFIKEIYDGEIIQSYRDKYEIDIYLPQLGVGFEYNGLYWHSEENKHKRYHLDKTEYFELKGIRIIHIWEDDWNINSDIIKSQIKNIIGLSKKVYARNTTIKVINSVKIVRDFLNQNHIQGYAPSVLKFGLYYNNDLISVMTFDHFEGRKKMNDDEWNLNRFCTKKEMVVIGGASKLFNFFLKEISPKRIISYSDRDWSIGNLYNKLGFNLISKSEPDYKYVINNKRVHKSNMKKSKIEYKITESEYFKSKNIYRIWDCGKLKFEITFK